MMNKRAPVIVTVILLLGGLLLFTQRDRWAQKFSAPKEAATPEDVIWRMADAAREGEAQAYLDCFTGTLQQSLRKTAAEMGEAKFKAYLQQRHGEATGIAVSEFEQLAAQTATLRVEFVYRDKSEAEKYHFKLLNGRWRIESVDGSESITLRIPYGAGVAEKE